MINMAGWKCPFLMEVQKSRNTGLSIAMFDFQRSEGIGNLQKTGPLWVG